uniref:tRNA (guanine(10)-N(2))-methyltransferase TRMT11 n=2 Tax=Parascaris univalens TaxID=6257 RepID=A0A915ASC3_PARUN
KYVLVFSQAHLDFRIAEFRSVCSLWDIDACCSRDLSPEKHIFIAEFESDICLHRILSRAVLIKAAFELIAVAKSYQRLFEDIRIGSAQFEKYNSSLQSFAIRILSFGKKRSADYCNEIIDKLGGMLPLDKCPIDLENASNVFTVIEEYENCGDRDSSLSNIYFGRLIGYGQSRLKNLYNLRERCYIGNTTMDPELSFIQANLIKANMGSIVLDPFCGTGGLLISAAHFGAAVIGTEINYQIARAVGKSSRVGKKFLTDKESVVANFKQYEIDDRFMSLIIADASRHTMWRCGDNRNDGIFDAIVADPPYGVREKGRKVGNKERKTRWTFPGNHHEIRYPEKTKYALSSVFTDLLELAVSVLVIGGRLSFWFPVFREEYSEEVIPRHDALRLVANCEQPLGSKYSRRLLVYEKLRSRHDGERAYVEEDCYSEMTFRQRIFVNNN